MLILLHDYDAYDDCHDYDDYVDYNQMMILNIMMIMWQYEKDATNSKYLTSAASNLKYFDISPQSGTFTDIDMPGDYMNFNGHMMKMTLTMTMLLMTMTMTMTMMSSPSRSSALYRGCSRTARFTSVLIPVKQ